jgi:hypothetical protein
MDGIGNPCTEIKLRVRRGDRTRTCDPWSPDQHLFPDAMLSSEIVVLWRIGWNDD